jgi:hypothetical protein
VLAVNEMIPGLSRPAGSGPATARGAADVVLIVLMLVIMLSGDVELNPGPPKSKAGTCINTQFFYLGDNCFRHKSSLDCVR